MQGYVDNQIYDTLGDDWWSPNHFMCLLQHGINPLRIQYLTHTISNKIGPLAHKKLLDVGCGAGFLSESCAQIGMTVTGIDQSKNSIDTARRHAEKSQLNIKYQVANGLKIPFDNDCFDFVSCCDVLEHVTDTNTFIEEISRVLKPGGVFLFDTINRTIFSYITHIWLAQSCPWTAWMPPHTHAWSYFIKPNELKSMLTRHQLIWQDSSGFGPQANPIIMLKNIIKLKYKKISWIDFTHQCRFNFCTNHYGSYIGFGQKSS